MKTKLYHLFILLALLVGIHQASAQTWTQTSALITNWQAIAVSSNGTKLAAVVSGGGIYTSSDSGNTWTQTSASNANWSAIASSSDGTKLAAAINAGGIYISTNSGATWNLSSATNSQWDTIASSADGTKLVAQSDNNNNSALNGIYTSTNSGVSWIQNPLASPAGATGAIATSADGSTILFAQYYNPMWISTNSGNTWFNAEINGVWNSCACSADGTKMVAAQYKVNPFNNQNSPVPGSIYTSTNSGASWVLSSAPTNVNWISVASSSAGSTLAAAVSGGGIWISTNFGANWIQQTGAPNASWSSIASSADGTQLVAAVNGGGIYTAQTTLSSTAQTNIFLFSGSETNITLPPGTYIITAYGAQGGNGALAGGLGAEMSAKFSFQTNTMLTLLVGGSGASGGSAGGGGSFVVNGSTPLVIAGGGGGAGAGGGGGSGLIGTNGGNGASGGNFGGNGGIGGGGGSGGGHGSGGGGGGYSSNGSNGSNGGIGGNSFLSGGVGGANGGGYGGGGGYVGGGGYGGGGGGGYSGGGGGGGSPSGGGAGGGGGGSIIDSSSISNLTEVSGIASPDGSPNGEIIITTVSPPVPFTYTTNNGTITITGYTGSSGAVTVPGAINGYPVTSIGNVAFSETNVTSVMIPSSVTSIAQLLFDGPNLTAITVATNNPVFSSVAGVLFDKNQDTLIECPGGLAGSYTIPNSVTTIAETAFWQCRNLTSVTMGNSVNSIARDAFANATSLTNILIGNGVTSIGYYAFWNCTSLTTITIPGSVTNIGYGAVNVGTFSGCTSLTSIFFGGNAPIPNNDTSVFQFDANAVAYYLLGTVGWGATFDGIPTSAILPPAPKLGISSYGSQPAVFFPTATGTNFVLQMNTDLNTTNWVTVSNAIPISGFIITNSSGAVFFRLH